MENTNEMTLIFDSRPVNEGLARVAAASVFTQVNTTQGIVAAVKTAGSAGVTNRGKYIRYGWISV